jgi:hypothetical protein
MSQRTCSNDLLDKIMSSSVIDYTYSSLALLYCFWSVLIEQVTYLNFCTPTRRPVSKRPISKRPVSKRMSC